MLAWMTNIDQNGPGGRRLARWGRRSGGAGCGREDQYGLGVQRGGISDSLADTRD